METQLSLFVLFALALWRGLRGRAIPDIEKLPLPNSPLWQLVHQAYVEQISLGWNLLFRGFWFSSWRKAQEYECSHSPFHRGHIDNEESWASRAQVWMFDLFDLAWGCEMLMNMERTLRKSE